MKRAKSSQSLERISLSSMINNYLSISPITGIGTKEGNKVIEESNKDRSKFFKKFSEQLSKAIEYRFKIIDSHKEMEHVRHPNSGKGV